MAAQDTYAIVGAGLAGGKAVEALREQGYDGRLVLIGAEPHLPYERPPLSKGYLTGSAERDSMVVHDQAWYDEQRVELRLGTEVTGIDRVRQAAQPERRRRAAPTTSCCWPPAPARARCRCPAPTPAACTTCARWRTPTGCASCSAGSSGWW